MKNREDREARLLVIIAILFSVMIITILLSGIIATEINSGAKAIKGIRTAAGIASDISTSIGVIIAGYTIHSWRSQYINSRTIDCAELLIEKTEEIISYFTTKYFMKYISIDDMEEKFSEASRKASNIKEHIKKIKTRPAIEQNLRRFCVEIESELNEISTRNRAMANLKNSVRRYTETIEEIDDLEKKGLTSSRTSKRRRFNEGEIFKKSIKPIRNTDEKKTMEEMLSELEELKIKYSIIESVENKNIESIKNIELILERIIGRYSSI